MVGRRAGRAWVLAGSVAMLAAPVAAQIVAPSGRTLFADHLLLRTLVRFDAFEAVDDGRDLERWRAVTTGVWGVAPRWTLSGVVPTVQTRSSEPGGAARRRSGTADASIFARYDLYRRTVRSGFTRLSPEFGVKLPTGGAFGTGSTDVSLGLILSHVRDPDWWVADAQATLPGEGDGDLRAGDRWRFDLAYLRRVYPRDAMGTPMVLAVLELNAERAEHSRRGGAAVVESGGDVVFLSPGIQALLSRQWALELSVPVVVAENFHGSGPTPEASVILGARWLF